MKFKDILWYGLLMTFCIPYAVSHFIPRTSRLWVFGYGGGEGFTDNSKHLFLHTAVNCPDIRPVWITDDQDVVNQVGSRGYEVYHTSSPKAVYFSLRAEVVFVTHSLHDVLWWCSGGSKVVRLNHGIPFKKSHWANKAERDSIDVAKSLFNRHIFWNYDYSIAPSMSYTSKVAEMTGVKEHNIIPAGLPRMDMFFDPPYDVEVGCDETVRTRVPDLAEDHKILFYFQTWRSESSEDSLRFDISSMDKILAEHDAYLLLCTHTNTDTKRDVSGSERIISLSTDTDFYPVLQYVDVAITDYSSLFYDFLLADCPVVFVHFDANLYLSNREMVIDIDELPGVRVHTPEELYDTLNEILSADREPPESILRWRKHVFDGNLGGNCQRLVDSLSRTL